MPNERIKPIDDKEFDRLLFEEINNYESYDIVTCIPGVYELVAEHFNNDILDRYEEENSHFLDYETVFDQFTDGRAIDEMKELYKDDIIMLWEGWNNYTDMLCKEGQISKYAYENWENPF